MRGLDPRIHGAAWAVFAGWAVAPATALSLPQSRAVPRRATVLPSGPQRRAPVSTWLPREIEAKRGALQQVLRPIDEAGGLPNGRTGRDTVRNHDTNANLGCRH